MKTIWKFNVGGLGQTTIEMPRGAEILSVQAQRGEVVMWAAVDERAATEVRAFVVVGTGSREGVDEHTCRFIGTVQLYDGDLVLHVFEHDNKLWLKRAIGGAL